MENVRNAAESEKHLSFDEIVEAARKRHESERAEYDKASLEHYKEKKAADGRDGRYALGSFYNEVRTQHFRDTAETLNVLSARYAGILSDYRDQYDKLDKQKAENEEKAEYLEACIRHMNNVINAQSAVSGYLSGSEGTPSERFSSARSALDRCLESFEDIMVCRISDAEFKAGDPLDVRSSYAEIADMSSFMDTLQSGLLVRPNSVNSINGEKTIDGKKIHYVDAAQSQPTHEFEASAYEEFEKHNFHPEKRLRDRSDEPLFDHLPDTDDIHQGILGNCYMLASLSAILRQNPELILQSMRENPPEEAPGYDPNRPETHKKTVTVRFFNDDMEPVYVTVDKTVPKLFDPATGRERDSYSRGPLWVQILEKAYAASGLHKGVLSEAEAGTLNASYTDITGGKTDAFIPQLLGAGENGATGTTVTLKKSNELSMYVPGTGYTRDQIDRFEMIEKACEANIIATCSTFDEYDFNKRFSSDKAAQEKQRGIVKNHAYTIVGTERDADTGRMYVIIRNPHKSGGTAMDGSGSADSKAKGYIKIDFNAFDNRFEQVLLHDFSVAAKKTDMMPEIRDLRRMYGSTLKELDASLRSTDSRMLRMIGNSREFTRFRKAAKAAVSAVSSMNATPEVIKKKMEDLFTAARNYDTHCSRKNITQKSSFRDLERLKMARVTKELEKEYRSGKNNETTMEWLGDRVGIATSAYEQTKLLRAQTKAFVSGLDGETPEKRRGFYAQVSKFINNNEYKKLNVQELASMSKQEKFDFFRKPENVVRYTCLVMLADYSDKVIGKMIDDGFIASGSAEEMELRFKSAAFAGVRKSVEFVLDSGRYSADMFAAGKGRQELDALAREGKKAADDLGRFEQIKKTGGLSAAVESIRVPAPARPDIESAAPTA